MAIARDYVDDAEKEEGEKKITSRCRNKLGSRSRYPCYW
jgi:hypothetical protein